MCEIINVPAFLPEPSEPYETEPVAIATRAEIQDLFSRAETLARQYGVELSIVERKRRARLARMTYGEDDA